jgi:hypothetical protein
MGTTPLDDLRVEVAAGPVRDLVQQHLQPRTSTAGSLSSSPREVLGQLGLHVGELIGAQDLRHARKTPRAGRSAVLVERSEP